MKRKAIVVYVAGATLAIAALAQAADTYPTRPIRAVVPFTPGSTTDIIARSVGERLNVGLGQNVIIDNRSGAGGTIGAAIAAQAPADGYTLLIHSSSHTVNPAMYAKLPYDTVRDFSGITPLASLPNVLVISPSKGIRSVKDLIAAAKSKPGSVTFASAGQGSATHLNAEKFRVRAGMEVVHPPSKEAADGALVFRPGWGGRVSGGAGAPALAGGCIREGAVAFGSPVSVETGLGTRGRRGPAPSRADCRVRHIVPAGTPGTVGTAGPGTGRGWTPKPKTNPSRPATGRTFWSTPAPWPRPSSPSRCPPRKHRAPGEKTTIKGSASASSCTA